MRSGVDGFSEGIAAPLKWTRKCQLKRNAGMYITMPCVNSRSAVASCPSDYNELPILNC